GGLGMANETPTGPLTGYTVIDLSRALAGPHAGMMFGDLGARVIKVENPGRGDDSRSWGPPFVGPEDDPQATYFFSCNRNKESIALDLKSDTGKDTLTGLIARADVLIENFRSGVLDRLGFSTTRCMEINPRLVILSITGFGHDGPEASRAGYDQIAQGEAGLMSLTGSGPDDMQRVGVPIADLLAGIYGSYRALAALLARERTRRGKAVRPPPDLVILSSTGFGHDGPEASRAGYDQIAQGEAGLMSLTGSGPDDMQRVGVPIADLLAGIYGSYGVLAALLERERTGRGKVVRTS